MQYKYVCKKGLGVAKLSPLHQPSTITINNCSYTLMFIDDIHIHLKHQIWSKDYNYKLQTTTNTANGIGITKTMNSCTLTYFHTHISVVT